MTDTTFDVPVVTLSTQDNAKMLEQFSSDFKTTINWNKYQSKVSTERQSKYLDLLIDPTFQGVDRIFFFFYCLKMRSVEKYIKDIILQM